MMFYGDYWEVEVGKTLIHKRFEKHGEFVPELSDENRKVYRLRPDQVNIRSGSRKRVLTDEQRAAMREIALRRFGHVAPEDSSELVEVEEEDAE